MPPNLQEFPCNFPITRIGDAPLWMHLGYGGCKINIKYIKSQILYTFHQALIAQMVERLNSDQKAIGLSSTSANETIMKKCNNLFNVNASVPLKWLSPRLLYS